MRCGDRAGEDRAEALHGASQRSRFPSALPAVLAENGWLHGARLTIDKELKDHAGEGSMTKFQSTYTIQYADDR